MYSFFVCWKSFNFRVKRDNVLAGEWIGRLFSISWQRVWRICPEMAKICCYTTMTTKLTTKFPWFNVSYDLFVHWDHTDFVKQSSLLPKQGPAWTDCIYKEGQKHLDEPQYDVRKLWANFTWKIVGTWSLIIIILPFYHFYKTSNLFPKLRRVIITEGGMNYETLKLVSIWFGFLRLERDPTAVSSSEVWRTRLLLNWKE